MSKIIRGNGQVKSLHFDPIEGDQKHGASLHSDRLKKELEEREQAEDLVAKAKLIVKEAEEKAHSIELEAYQRGFEEGINASKAEVAQTLMLVKSIAEQALEEKWKVVNSAEKSVVNLALEIAEKIINEQVRIKPETVLNIAKKALMMAAEREHIQVRVNPADLDIMKAHKEELMASMDGIQKIEVIADRRVKRGGCVLETSVGNVDARIQSQLSEIGNSLREVASGD